MSGMELLWPALAAVLPGIWSYGHKRRMTWTALVLLLLPVLVTFPGTLLLGAAGLAWRNVVWLVCGMGFVTGCAVLFVWTGVWFWKEVPAGRWHVLAVWLCRGAGMAFIGAMCIFFTMFSAFLAIFAGFPDQVTEKDGELVVVEYVWMDKHNYYEYHGPLLQGVEPLEGSWSLTR